MIRLNEELGTRDLVHRWVPPGDMPIVAAAASPTQVVVGLYGGDLIVLAVTGHELAGVPVSLRVVARSPAAVWSGRVGAASPLTQQANYGIEVSSLALEPADQHVPRARWCLVGTRPYHPSMGPVLSGRGDPFAQLAPPGVFLLDLAATADVVPGQSVASLTCVAQLPLPSPSPSSSSAPLAASSRAFPVSLVLSLAPGCDAQVPDARSVGTASSSAVGVGAAVAAAEPRDWDVVGAAAALPPGTASARLLGARIEHSSDVGGGGGGGSGGGALSALDPRVTTLLHSEGVLGAGGPSAGSPDGAEAEMLALVGGDPEGAVVGGAGSWTTLCLASVGLSNGLLLYAVLDPWTGALGPPGARYIGPGPVGLSRLLARSGRAARLPAWRGPRGPALRPPASTAHFARRTRFWQPS